MTLTAVEAVSGERVDVLVELEPHDPVSTLEAALVPLLPPGRPGLWRGSRPLPPDEHVGTAGVLAGCVLTLGGPGPDVVLPSAGAVLQVVSGPGSGGLHALAEGEVVVGGQAPGGAPPPDGPAP
ncbi:MAG: hypothetical protein ACXVGH_12370, partial [Mycobacteriales bacterium]